MHARQAIPNLEGAAQAAQNALILGQMKAVNARATAAAHQVTASHIPVRRKEAASVHILAVTREVSASHTTAPHRAIASLIPDLLTQEPNALTPAAKRVESAKLMAAAHLAIASHTLVRRPAKKDLTLAL